MTGNPHFLKLLILIVSIALISACALLPSAISTPTTQAIDTDAPKPTDTRPASTATSTLEEPAVPIEEATATNISPMAASVPVIQHYEPGQAITITEINMVSLQAGWAIASEGGEHVDHIVYTRDGGHTWADVTPPEIANEQNKRAIAYFLDREKAWVTYYPAERMLDMVDPIVWYTEDGGQQWEEGGRLENAGGEDAFLPTLMTFSDAQHGWIRVHVGAGMSHDYSSLYHTQDGGRTWERILDPYTSQHLHICEKSGMVFTDALNGWVTLSCKGLMPGVKLLYTNDGGRSWGEVILPAPDERPDLFEAYPMCKTHSPHLWDIENGLLGVSCRYPKDDGYFENFLYKTADGGQTWKPSICPPGDLQFISFYQGYTLGRNMAQIDEVGGTWEDRARVAWDGQFDMLNTQYGWAAALAPDGERALLFTQDGAATWHMLAPVIIGE